MLKIIKEREIKREIVKYISEYFDFSILKSMKYFNCFINNYFFYVHKRLAHGHTVTVLEYSISLVMDFEGNIPFPKKSTLNFSPLRSKFFPGKVFYLIIEHHNEGIVSKDYFITPCKKFRYLYDNILNSDLVYKLM